MNFAAPFIRRPVMTTLIMLAIAVAGWMAFRLLPVSDLPNIDNPKIMVITDYPGAAPDVVLKQVTIPIEKALNEVKGIKELCSVSAQDLSMINLTFDLNKNMDEVVRDLQAALHHAEETLPPNLPNKPRYFREQRSKEPILSFILTSATVNVGQLRSIADANIIPRLTRLEGVANVGIFGSEKSLWIKVNPEILAARNIGFNQIVDTIKTYTEQMPLGKIHSSGKSLSIELNSGPLTIEKFENLRLQGSDVKLHEVAEVTDTTDRDIVFHYASDNRLTNALVINLTKTAEANTVAIADSAKELLKQMQRELPPEIELTIGFDKSIWIEQSISEVKWSLAFAFVLVCLVIYFSLGRLTDALIPSLALPLSIVGTFILMYLLNFSIDLLSLLALTLCVGFVVDDAIVVLENIVRHQEEGKNRWEASFSGSKQIAFTIVSMTLSLVAVFIPLLFMPGMNGKLFREFSLTLAFAIIVSGFISLTLTPMLCSRLLSENRKVVKKSSKLVAQYVKSLSALLNYPKTVLTCALLLSLLSVPIFTRLSVQLFPPEDRGALFTSVSLPSGITQTEMNRYQAKIERVLQANPHVQSFFDFGWENNLGFFITLVPQNRRPPQNEVVAEIQRALDQEPGFRSFTQGFQLLTLDFDFMQVGQYKYVLKGLRLEEVIAAAKTLSVELSKEPTFAFVETSIREDDPKLIVDVDDEKAHLFGFTKQHIQELLSHAYSKFLLAEVYHGTLQQKIFLDLSPEWGRILSSLEKLVLKNEEGHLVPLDSLCKWEERRGMPDFYRHDQLPGVEVYFSLNENVSPNVGIKRFDEMAQKLLPPTVTGHLIGSAKTIANANSETLLLLFAAAIVMYIVLGILYESFIHPLTILSSLPFASLGGLLTLYLFGEPISIFSAVGFLLLLGIVKKNGIMMVDYALEAKNAGLSAREAIIAGSQARFRPIMMTTVAAIMGALPIAIGIGEGSQIYRGLGLVIVGGLLFSQVLTLYVTPVLFLLFERLKSRSSRT